MVKKFWPIGLAALFLLFAGIFALTQEADEDSSLDELPLDDIFVSFPEEDEAEEPPPLWEPPGPPRWFRSNASGMTLEEIPSRLAALHNQYALVIDYAAPREIEPRLLQYYQNDYIVELRVLYEQGVESRRQWLFRDKTGNTRLNAVFMPPSDTIDTLSDDEPQETPAPVSRAAPVSMGFIEIFNERTRIIEERQFFDDNSEVLIIYSYNNNILIKAEAHDKLPDGEFHAVYVDHYRYNRSYSLRYVERQFHQYDRDAPYIQPVRLNFPARVLDTALDKNFTNDLLTVSSDFMGTFTAGEGYRITYQTDNRRRILTQTMFNNKNEEVWVINNTWSGDRIVAMQKREGDDEKVTEYEYDREGNRILQRDIHNGVLERVVHTDGENETEELYFDGVLMLKAYWVNGRKVNEERVRWR
jgi:hypothetical protein